MERRQHIVLMPFLAQGHIIPFLELAKLIDRRYPGRFTVTIVSTPLNVRNLRSSLPPHSGILLRELPFHSADHGLPADTENTDSVTPSPHSWLRLFQASGSLRPQFERLVAEGMTRRPLCIIADVFTSWTVHIAKQLGVFHAIFTTCGGFGTAAYFSVWLHLPHAHTASEDDEFGVPGFPETYRLRRSQISTTLRTADGRDPWAVLFRELITHCSSSDAMLCNTVEALEPAGTALLRSNTGLRMWSIGPVLSSLESKFGSRRAGRALGISPETCIEWLDAHPPRSVLYVSFGSQNSISAPQMMQLAMGLEASGRPFIWVIRPPFGFDVKGVFRAEWLPEGFEDRTGRSGRGLLVRNWAPQLEILSHGSVGAFLSHCGWNSVLESLGRGVPLIGWPLAAEQFYNFKMLDEELGVCVELARGVDQKVDSAEVERVIELVVGDEKGEDMRRKAASAAETIRAATGEEGDEKGPSLAALDDFMDTVLKETPIIDAEA
uniref:Glycosyltransferase n=1 Tax=Anthurium amnicola TaxID=1678845 RepID=A0A1D1XGI0_9ARAE